MTTVQFNNVPGNIIVPFFYAEINSGGTPYTDTARLLLAGQKTAAGSAPAGVPVGPIQSANEADALFGIGSMAAQMVRLARSNAPFQPIWVLPLADPAGAAAAGSLNITAAPGVTGAGVVTVMGRRVAFQINAADTAATVAANLVAAVNALSLPVVATVDGVTASKADFTARHVGALGNTIVVEVSTDEPNALTAANTNLVAIGTGTPGTGIPDLVTPLANLGDDEYDFIAAPYSDAASLNAVRDFLDDVQGRWSPSKQLYGHYFTVNFGTLSANVTLGSGRNDQHVSIVASQLSPTPTWEWAAAIGGVAALHLSSAPELSRPLQTLTLTGILPPEDRSKWWAIVDRQALYSNGIGATKVVSGGIVTLDRVVTTYQKTKAGVPDATFRDVETMAQLMFLTRSFRSAVSNRHSRQALADANPFNVAEVTTPKDIRNTLIHAYNDLVAQGVVENADLFSQFVTVVRNVNDATRVDAFLPVDVVNQLRVFAANITAFLQYQTASGQTAF